MAERSTDPGVTIESLGEFGLIDRLARIVGRPGVDPLRPDATGAIGIGDDAAIWTPTPGVSEVLTTDALVEDVHFRLSTTSWRDLGWKALAENVSDIAAMGAEPRRAFVTLGLPPRTRICDLEDLYRGMNDLLEELSWTRWSGPLIEGGDTVSAPVVMISITVVGELRGEGLRRSAGKAGDLLAVTGSLGGSAGGLALLESGHAPLGDPDVADLIRYHRKPMPRVGDGVTLAQAGVRCGMDLSDGLLGDAGKLAYASGLTAVVEAHRVPMPPSLMRRFDANTARTMALRGGEDYELLIAAPPDCFTKLYPLLDEVGIVLPTVVGRLERGTPGQVTVLDEWGQPMDVGGGSWDHFGGQQERP